MTPFNNIRKLFNVHLGTSDVFEQRCFENSRITGFHGVASKRCFLFLVLPDVMWVLLERRVDVFLSVWNKLRTSLDTNGEYFSFPALF